ncbi:MAG: cytochrome b/b6 domain-containing protein [Cruoricaptor ignavus]|nr:cytochrome b/b6 domain-containing protein [Cruoricaptor ignavus]
MERISAKKYPVMRRFLHWLVALLLTVLFITGFIRKYWMNKGVLATTISEGSHNAVSQSQATDIARTIISPMWEWHIYAAYAMFVAVALRFIYLAFTRKVNFPNPFAKNLSLKCRLQGVVYLFFYLLLLLSTISGIALKWGAKDMQPIMKTIHLWAIYWVPIFIFLHFVGIYLEERGKDKGIASKMIAGD